MNDALKHPFTALLPPGCFLSRNATTVPIGLLPGIERGGLQSGYEREQALTRSIK